MQRLPLANFWAVMRRNSSIGLSAEEAAGADLHTSLEHELAVLEVALRLMWISLVSRGYSMFTTQEGTGEARAGSSCKRRRMGFRPLTSTQVAVLPVLRPESRLSRELGDKLYSVKFDTKRRKPLTLTAWGDVALPLQLIAWKDDGVLIYGRVPLERSPSALGVVEAYKQESFSIAPGVCARVFCELAGYCAGLYTDATTNHTINACCLEQRCLHVSQGFTVGYLDEMSEEKSADGTPIADGQAEVGKAIGEVQVYHCILLVDAITTLLGKSKSWLAQALGLFQTSIGGQRSRPAAQTRYVLPIAVNEVRWNVLGKVIRNVRCITGAQ
eukprot:6472003-Amphidinium_carterae.3